MSAPTVTGSNGPVRLGQRLGKGGEGEVYEVVGQPGLVAKIYLRDIAPDRAEKLRVMPPLLTPKLASLTAWPHDVLTGRGGKIAGFLMPKIRAHDVHKVYGPKSRQQVFPEADWRLLVRTALNTARAFAVVHEAGFLVADVNHGGVMVAQDATVRLIDCDSFQISVGTRTFLCEVGVEEFTPPELQGRSFRGVTRTTNQDNFGLAVLIFQLLMLGRHPFAGRHKGKGDLSIGEAISQCKYVYSHDKARTLMEPPPMTAPVLAAGAEVARLWEQAFAPAGMKPGGRPTAEQWVVALQRLEGGFVRCPNHAGHFFARGISCPWCPIQMGTGSSPFPLPAGQRPPIHTGGPFSLEAVWAQITSVQPPPAAQPTSTINSVTPPSPEAQKYASAKSFFKALAFISAGCVFLGGLVVGIIWLFAAIGAWVAYAIVSGLTPSIDRSKYTQRRSQAQGELRSLSDRWAKEASSQVFETKLAQLRGMRDEYRQLATKRETEYQSLVRNRESIAKQRFLDTFEIGAASISGIGPAKKAMLESYGIETAADVTTHSVMKVPGFGPALTKRIVGWRRNLEGKFRFDPNTGVDPRAVAELDQRIAQTKRDLEHSLRQGAGDLHTLRMSILNRRQALEGPMRLAAQSLAQAEADLAAIQ